ncbi:excisionase family DNA-binding protein [Micromonospora sp. RL09-050-HVF-A]|uniref:excisionase family DNA-binding protein n=1 Tax=Micromonospora sp. RL09-050-HVF-A TaxID=1703433 RepID=UPI001C6018F0|nr:excisionase family DNA-binding protein [Micromonospora sp. RL09-050-HVF-A]MBW4703120.1 excisionase family DNA-binding protein [Micromonospora sp. RL09-050-HVF-A]
MAAEAIMPGDSERHSLTELVSLLHDGSGALAVTRGGVQVEVSLSVRDVLTRIADVLASGRGVAIVPVDRELTTTEAAGLLGVSRPTLIKLLEAGEIGYSRPNSSRRIPLDQVLAYRDRRGQARRALLDELTADAVEMGMYGQPAPVETDDAA